MKIEIFHVKNQFWLSYILHVNDVYIDSYHQYEFSNNCVKFYDDIGSTGSGSVRGQLIKQIPVTDTDSFEYKEIDSKKRTGNVG